MKPISPIIPGLEEHEVKIAENQDEYETLVALPIDNGQRVISRWHLSWRERLTLLFNGSIYLHVWTFNRSIWADGTEIQSKNFTFDAMLREIERNDFWEDPDKAEVKAKIAASMRQFLKKLEQSTA